MANEPTRGIPVYRNQQTQNTTPQPNKADPSTWNRNPTGWTPAQPGTPQYEYVRHSLSEGRQPYGYMTNRPAPSPRHGGGYARPQPRQRPPTGGIPVFQITPGIGPGTPRGPSRYGGGHPRPPPPQKVIRPSPYPAPVNRHGMPTNPDWRDRRAYSPISQSPRRYEQNKPGEPRWGLTPVKNALYDNRGRIGGYRFELGIPKKPIKFL